MSNKTLQDRLKTIQRGAVNDKPPVAEASRRKKRRTAAARPAPNAEKRTMSITLTAEANAALKSIQAFMLTECGASSPSAAQVICVALQDMAEAMKSRKAGMERQLAKWREGDLRGKHNSKTG